MDVAVEIRSGEGEAAGDHGVHAGGDQHVLGRMFGNAVFRDRMTGERFRDFFELWRRRPVDLAGTGEQNLRRAALPGEFQHLFRSLQDDVALFSRRQGLDGRRRVNDQIKTGLRQGKRTHISRDQADIGQAGQVRTRLPESVRIARQNGDRGVGKHAPTALVEYALAEKTGSAGQEDLLAAQRLKRHVRTSFHFGTKSTYVRSS